MLAVLNASQFFGRIIPTALSDIYGGSDLLMLAQILFGLLGFHWIGVSNVGGFVEFLILVGFVSGMIATLPATVIPYVSPNPETLGTRVGMAYAVAGVGVLIGNPVALALTESTSRRSGFLGVQLFMGFFALAGAVAFILPARVAKRNWKAARAAEDAPTTS